ncbi:hypothetical protein ACS0TY_014095 [Phlomoides rotata]
MAPTPLPSKRRLHRASSRPAPPPPFSSCDISSHRPTAAPQPSDNSAQPISVRGGKVSSVNHGSQLVD